MRMRVRSLTSLSGLRIHCCHELWCRSQMWLGSSVAVYRHRPAAVAPIWPLAWEVPYGIGAGLKKKKKICFKCNGASLVFNCLSAHSANVNEKLDQRFSDFWCMRITWRAFFNPPPPTPAPSSAFPIQWILWKGLKRAIPGNADPAGVQTTLWVPEF